jgi:hypothetical protein
VVAGAMHVGVSQAFVVRVFKSAQGFQVLCH